MTRARFEFTSIDLTQPARVLSSRSTLAELPLGPAARVLRRSTLSDAVACMEGSGVSALLVEDDGIVTERDIARACGRGMDADAFVAEIATWHPITVPATTSIVDAAALMLNEHVRHLLVERPEGLAIVSLRDVTALLLQVADPELWLSSLRVAVDSPPELWLG